MYPCEITSPDGRTVRGLLDDEGNLVSVEPGAIGFDEAREIARQCVEDSTIDLDSEIDWKSLGL